MKSKILIAASLAAVFAVSMIETPMASAVGDFLGIGSAIVNSEENGLEAKLITHGLIPKDGSGGAFGYGILTSARLNGVIVATTHAGVQDSQLQTSASDPVWHTHFVTLGSGNSLCNGSPNVTDITFEAPGKVIVDKNTIHFDDIPSTFTGTNALTGATTTITPGTSVDNVVSFTLDPKFDGSGHLQAVCVENIAPATHVQINSEG
jgi:hypothetical protein